MENQESKERLHTAEIQEIISTPPKWLLRWGILGFFILLIIIFVVSASVKYPDTIKLKVKIETENQPAPVSLNESSRLYSILVKEGQFVVQGDSLILIENRTAKRHLITAPISGKVIFNDILSPGKLFQSNKEIIYISPYHGALFGDININQEKLGKVHLYQHVIIKLKEYPFEEFGFLTGKIGFISRRPNVQGLYNIKIIISGRSKGSKLSLEDINSGMIADAEIQLQKISILDRIFQGGLRSGKSLPQL